METGDQSGVTLDLLNKRRLEYLDALRRLDEARQQAIGAVKELDTLIAGVANMEKNTGLLDGLKEKGVDPRDSSSFARKGGSVNDEATRKGVAPTPKTIGPRDA